jgi:hypothetical protein
VHRLKFLLHQPYKMIGVLARDALSCATGEAFWHDKQQLCGAIPIIAPIDYIYWHDKASIAPTGVLPIELPIDPRAFSILRATSCKSPITDSPKNSTAVARTRSPQYS